MQYSLERFKNEELFEIEPREELAKDLEAAQNEAILNDVYTNGMPFFTLRADGKIIVIYGFVYVGCGTYMPMVIASKYIHKHIRKVIQVFYEYFATYVPKDCRRLEAYCDIMDEKALRLARHFGFDIIGIRHYASARGNDQAILEKMVLHEIRKVRTQW